MKLRNKNQCHFCKGNDLSGHSRGCPRYQIKLAEKPAAATGQPSVMFVCRDDEIKNDFQKFLERQARILTAVKQYSDGAAAVEETQLTDDQLNAVFAGFHNQFSRAIFSIYEKGFNQLLADLRTLVEIRDLGTVPPPAEKNGGN